MQNAMLKDNVALDISVAATSATMLPVERSHVCHYQVRGQEGMQLLEGIDTLLVQLLVQLGDAARLAALAAGHSRVAVHQVFEPLRDARRFHALALLHAARDEPEQALELWRVRTSGSLSTSGKSHRCSVRRVQMRGARSMHATYMTAEGRLVT